MTTDPPPDDWRAFLVMLRQALLLGDDGRARGMIIAWIEQHLGLDTPAHRPNAATRRRHKRAGPVPPPP